MFSSAAASSLGVNAREMVLRSPACSAPSMLTMELPNTALAQGAGSGVVTPGCAGEDLWLPARGLHVRVPHQRVEAACVSPYEG